MHSIAAFTKHIRGALTLQEIRGPQQLETERLVHLPAIAWTLVSLVLYACGAAITNDGYQIMACVQYYVPIPRELLKWTEIVDRLTPPHRKPDNALGDIVVRFGDIRAANQTGKIT